jgi:hypothetical protein
MVRKLLVICAGMVLVGASVAYAAFPPIDLTTSGASYVGSDNVQWNQLTSQPTGTGVYDPFLRIQATGSESGFNTDFLSPPPLDDKASIYTHSVVFGDLGVVKNAANVDCYRFTLDINEPDGYPAAYLSLDKLQIYTSSNAGAATFTTMAQVIAGSTLRYDMDGAGDQTVYMDYNLGAGSGQDDIQVLIPTSLFAGAAATDHLILFSQMGASGNSYQADFQSADGFEEWSVYQKAGTPVPMPEPTTLLLLGGGLVGMYFGRRRSRR